MLPACSTAAQPQPEAGDQLTFTDGKVDFAQGYDRRSERSRVLGQVLDGNHPAARDLSLGSIHAVVSSWDRMKPEPWMERKPGR
jgi:hypothetical protein